MKENYPMVENGVLPQAASLVEATAGDGFGCDGDRGTVSDTSPLRSVLKDAQGRPVTKAELVDQLAHAMAPKTWREAQAPQPEENDLIALKTWKFAQANERRFIRLAGLVVNALIDKGYINIIEQ